MLLYEILDSVSTLDCFFSLGRSVDGIVSGSAYWTFWLNLLNYLVGTCIAQAHVLTSIRVKRRVFVEAAVTLLRTLIHTNKHTVSHCMWSRV